MAGFLKDLSDAGAPLGQFAGAYAHKPLQHGYGNALDIETGFGQWGQHGLDSSPAFAAWAQAHPAEFAKIQADHHMKNLDVHLGGGKSDWGHFEWSPADRATVNAGMGAGSKSISGAGNIDVNVAAPSAPGTTSGLFKRLNQRRMRQMEPAAGGPVEPFA